MGLFLVVLQLGQGEDFKTSPIMLSCRRFAHKKTKSTLKKKIIGTCGAYVVEANRQLKKNKMSGR